MNKKVLIIISSVLFSFILWGSVTLSNSYFTTIKVPVRFTSLPKGFAVGYHSLKETNIRIKGEGWKLLSIMMGDNSDYLIPAGPDTDTKFVRLSGALGDNPWLSSGLQVFDISPDTMTFRLEKVREKKVKIKPEIELSFKPDYGLVSPVRVFPDSILITGPVSILKKIENVYTAAKAFRNLDDNVNESVELKHVDGLSYNRNYCEIKFEVQKIVDRSFEDLPVVVKNVPAGQSLVLIPGKINVVLRGGINMLGKLKPEEIYAYVDYNLAVKDTLGSLEPGLKVPYYTTVIDKKPVKLKYIIRRF